MQHRYRQNPEPILDSEATIIVLLIIPLVIGIAIYFIKWKPLHDFLDNTETKLLSYQEKLKNKKKGYFENIITYPSILTLNFCSFTLTKNIETLYLKNAVKATIFLYVFGLISSLFLALLTSVLFFVLGCGAFILLLWLAYKILLGSDSGSSYSPVSYIRNSSYDEGPIPITQRSDLLDTKVGEIKKDVSSKEEVYKKGTFFDEKIGTIEKGITGDKFIDNEGNEGEIKTPTFGKNKIIDKDGNEIGEYDKD